MIWIDPWVYIATAFLILTIPLNWLLAGIAAAVFHECCHLLSIYLTGGQVHRIRVCIRGAEIETGSFTDVHEFFCALAGPLGSLSLLMVIHWFPRLAICGLLQGGFNLIPIYPMDGGRILRCLLQMLCPMYAGKIETCIKWSFLAVSLFLCYRFWSWTPYP